MRSRPIPMQSIGARTGWLCSVQIHVTGLKMFPSKVYWMSLLMGLYLRNVFQVSFGDEQWQRRWR
jgi:hypothetical protein